MPQKRRAGGGAKLPPDGAGVHWDALQQQRRSRGRHRQDAVGAADLTAAHMDRTGNDLLRLEHFHQHTHAYHVRQSVHRPHFMEMNLVNGGPVDPALGIGNGSVDSLGVLPHPVADVQMGEDVGNVRQGRVMVVMMLVVMVVAFLLPMAKYLHVGAGNAAFLTLFCGDFNAG